MREITSHRGDPVNDGVKIETWDTKSGVPSQYDLTSPGDVEAVTIFFLTDKSNGVTDEAIAAVLEDRLSRACVASPSEENEFAHQCIANALRWLRTRAQKAAGVCPPPSVFAYAGRESPVGLQADYTGHNPPFYASSDAPNGPDADLAAQVKTSRAEFARGEYFDAKGLQRANEEMERLTQFLRDRFPKEVAGDNLDDDAVCVGRAILLLDRLWRLEH